MKSFGAGEGGGINYRDLAMAIAQSGSSRAGMYEEQQKMTTAFAALQGVASSLKKRFPPKTPALGFGGFPAAVGPGRLGRTGYNDSPGKQSDADVERSVQASYNKAADDLIHAFQAAPGWQSTRWMRGPCP